MLARRQGEKNILIVVARKAWQVAIAGVSKNGISYYEDKDPTHDRLICSVDSLKNLLCKGIKCGSMIILFLMNQN